MLKLGVLRTSKELVQLYQCPICRYFVVLENVVWKIKPLNHGDSGEIKCCSFCDGSCTHL